MATDEDLYYLPDGVYRAVARGPAYVGKEEKRGKRVIYGAVRAATWVKVEKIADVAQDVGSRVTDGPRPTRRSKP